MITYEKLFLVLKKKGISQNEAIKRGIVNNRSLNALKNNKNVNISTIDKLCNMLDCQPAEILTFTKDLPGEEEENKNER